MFSCIMTLSLAEKCHMFLFYLDWGKKNSITITVFKFKSKISDPSHDPAVMAFMLLESSLYSVELVNVVLCESCNNNTTLI